MPNNKRTLGGVLGGFAGLIGLSTVAGVLLAATVTPAIAVAGFAGSQAVSLFENLPNNLVVDAPMEPSTIYANDAAGNPFPLATFYDQNRIPLTFEQLNPLVIDAILSSEDNGFYSHGGVSIVGTLSALRDNLRSGSSRGGSTISQQFVKNVLMQECELGLTPGEEGYFEKSQQCWADAAQTSGNEGIQRKLQEMRYSIQIEKEYSKNQILVGYLNIANFGGQTYGIEAAAQRYFGVSAAQLNLEQAATLAGMVQDPNRLRIDQPGGSWSNREGEPLNSEEDGYVLTLDRRDYVLGRMFIDGKITQEQRDAALATQITPNIVATTQGCQPAGGYAYFCQYVRTVLASDPAFGETDADREALLRRGGLEIYTSMNVAIQDAGIEAMSQSVPPAIENIRIGAAGVTIEARTGRVLAIVQNTAFTEAIDAPEGESGLVFATDEAHGGSRGFGVGSTYKLFTLIDWLEKGNSINAVLDGRMRTFTSYTANGQTIPNSTAITNYGTGGGFTGTVARFTITSLNTGYLAMAQQLDVTDIHRVAERMGVSYATGGSLTDQTSLFSTLGSENVSPLAMAGAYATVANNGIYCTPRVIDRVVNQAGEEIPPPESSCTQAISPEVAATAAFALRGVVEGGGTGQAGWIGDGVPIFAKTGTNEQVHTTFAESSTETTTFLWVGNISGFESLRAFRMDQARFPITVAMQRAANSIYGGNQFPPPDRHLTRQTMADVPNVVGMSIEDARATLESAGFQVTVGEPVPSNVPPTVVAVQSPAGRAPQGGVITISPGDGSQIAVPNVTGGTGIEAWTTLADAGFAPALDTSCQTVGARVTGTNPAAGAASTAGASVTVTCG